MDPETRDMLTLHLVPGLGPRLTAALLERFGRPAEILRTSAEKLMEVPHMGSKLAQQLVHALSNVKLDEELGLIETFAVKILRLGRPEFPKGLATIPCPPHLLFVRGEIQPGDSEAVAIVGSRQCTSYGRRTAEKLAGDLAQAGFTIISGLARGIDGCAHLGALQAKGRTLAVLAGGLAKIYPPEHTDLAEEIIQSGALITESAMRMEPMAGMFPARNRIISGLARAVVVVEAGNKSGALITASHAAEQGRDVFAIPGPVDSPASEGTLELIRKGAKIIRNADDILEDLRGIVPKKSAKKSEGSVPLPLPDLNEFQQRIWNFLSDGPKHVDELTRLLAVPVGELSSNLLLMEMKRIIRRLPGNTFERR